MPKEKWCQHDYVNNGKMCFTSYLLYKQGAGIDYIYNMIMEESETESEAIIEMAIELGLDAHNIQDLIYINDTYPSFEEAKIKAIEYLEDMEN